MKILIVLASIVICGACAKKADTQATDVTPLPVKQGEENPVVPPPPNPPALPAPPATSQDPIAEFEYNQYIWTSHSIDVHGHILLSKASTEAITITVSFDDGTAIYPRDYEGFYGGSPRTYTIVFAPGERLMHLPSIYVANSPVCGGKFFMKMSTGADTKVILGSQAEIILNCN